MMDDTQNKNYPWQSKSSGMKYVIKSFVSKQFAMIQLNDFETFCCLISQIIDWLILCDAPLTLEIYQLRAT